MHFDEPSISAGIADSRDETQSYTWRHGELWDLKNERHSVSIKISICWWLVESLLLIGHHGRSLFITFSFGGRAFVFMLDVAISRQLNA